MRDITFKDMRKKLGLSQTELALLIGNVATNISKLERDILHPTLQQQSHLLAIEMLGEMGLLPELRRRIIETHLGYHARRNGGSINVGEVERDSP